jgi:hypothetical protein
MSSVIRKSNIHIVMVVLGLFVYVIAVGSRMVAGQYVCDKPTVVLVMVSMTIMLLCSLAGFIVSLVKRSKKIGVQSACIAFLAFVLYFFFYLLATQCPGW